MDETNQTVLLPATLSSEQYRGLIPKGETVATTASSVVLVAYNWQANTDRHRRLAKVVVFTNFDKFRKPPNHEKWERDQPGRRGAGAAEHTGLIRTIFERQDPNKWYCLRGRA